MSITSVATNNTPPTVIAKPYHRVENDDELPKVAVKERRPQIGQPMQEEQPKLNPGDNEDTWKKRYGDLRRFSQQKEKETEKTVRELQDQINKLTVAKSMEGLPKTAEEVAAWKEQYKDSYDIIVTVATSSLQSQMQALQNQIDSLKTTNEETEQEKAAAILTTLVPNWKSFNEDPQFIKWIMDPVRSEFKSIVYDSVDPYKIAEVLKMYMAVTGKTTPLKTEPKKEVNNVNAALAVQTPPSVELGNNQEKTIIRESEVAKLSRKDFEKFEDVIDQARREGRFVYDLSGKAQ